MVFKTEKDRNNAYHNTFSTNEGKMVLVDILGMLGFWDTIQSQNLSEVEHHVLSLYAKKILNRCGFWQSENIVGNMLKTKKKKWFERRPK